MNISPEEQSSPIINQNEIIKACKTYIKNNDLETLKTYYVNLQDLNINDGIYENIYQKSFLYACIIGSNEILKWLSEMYFNFPDISKIALRQLFFYGKYLLKRYKHNIEWYDDFLNDVKGILPFKTLNV